MNIKKSAALFTYIFAAISVFNSLYSFIQIIRDNEINIPQTTLSILAVIYLAGFLIYTAYKRICADSKIDFVTRLARYGHIHTVRMVLLKDQNKDKETAIKGKTAQFSFLVSQEAEGTSNVTYSHTLHVKITNSFKEVIFIPWVFEEDDVPPTQCEASFHDEEIAGSRPIFSNPKLLEVDYRDYSVNNGLYSITWNFGKSKLFRNSK